ncbi:MAG: hypothetical protein RR710_08025 [Oscillospiraceae bacterium]
MIDINWNEFALKHPKTTEAFENLCYYLFCRKYGYTEGIRTDFNQVGLETEPIKDKEGNYFGFQSKYFEKSVNYSNIESSIDKALKNYVNLNHITIYLNLPAQTSCKSAKAIEIKCAKKGITVEWFLPANFLINLNQPNNLDLAEFYFGELNALKMLSDSKSIRMNTLLQAKEYVELNLCNHETELSISNYSNFILQSSSKLHLFSGAAGTGKSVCMRKLFNIYGGFDSTTQENQLEIINKLGALCVFVNLNNTPLYSLESIILNYKRTYFANSTNNNFIYLFDGLDEISSSSITSTLLFIEDLLEKNTTKKIVISSRTSSYNKVIFKSTFLYAPEYAIQNLKIEQVQTYFEKKGDIDKIIKLKEFFDRDTAVFNYVTDILTLSLLWEHILYVKDSNLILNLMELSVSKMLHDVHHKKYLEGLNLPNPKSMCIVEINKQLSFYLFENEKFCFTQFDLYKIISNLYPKCNYHSINQIVSCLADSFYDLTVNDNIHTFSYRHRRYLEYFSLLSIEDKIQIDLCYLRERNIIINQDLFENMLIPYLRDKALKNKDISMAFEIGLLNVYLGNDSAWGVDKSFYYWSSCIVFAIAALPDNILQNVIEDKSFPISNFFNEVPERILCALSNSEKPSFSEDFKHAYLNFTLLIVLTHKLGDKEILDNLLVKYKEIDKLCRKKKYSFNAISNRDNYLVWKNILYIKTVIFSDNVDAIIDTAIEKSIDININDLFKEYIDTNILYLSSLYYNILIYYPEKCANIVKDMNLHQISVFTLAISKPECVYTIHNNADIQDALIEKLQLEISDNTLSAVICLAMKKILCCSLTKNEVDIVTNYLHDNPFKDYSVFWKEHCDIVGFILMAFSQLLNLSTLDAGVRQYLIMYDAYFQLLNGTYTISKFATEAKKYLNNNSEVKYYIKILLGKALAFCDVDESSITGAVDFLNYTNNSGGLLIVYYTMKQYNPEKFNRIISISLINRLNSLKVYQDIDYTSTSDLIFIISFLASSHNGLLSYDLLLKGLSNGMMRMNERKDTIGDYKLLESLEIILKNNWLSTEQLITYLDRIILISNRMNTYHIENDVHGKAIDILLKYHFEAAEYYYNHISSLDETYNNIHFDFAMGLVRRGRNVEIIEECLDHIIGTYDRYYQKIEWNSFYFKISVYLHIATCDFYSTSIQKKYFQKAQKMIDELECAGWKRELKDREYKIYIKLCSSQNKEIDVIQEKKVEYSVVPSTRVNCTLKNLEDINSTQEFKCLIEKFPQEHLIDNIEISDLLIKKSIDLTGNIDEIIALLSRSYYPSNVSYSGYNYWMIIVSALKNPQSKNSIFSYLISHGGGHDGFSELIKIYGHLKNKDICLDAFRSLMRCIEFLLC